MQVSFRIPETMAQAIDKIATQKSASSGGVPINRTQVVVLALREWIAQQEARLSAVREQDSEIRKAAIKLGFAWAQTAKPAELKKLARIAGEDRAFDPQSLHDATFPGHWAYLVLELPSLKKISHPDSAFQAHEWYREKLGRDETFALPDVDGEVRVLLSDEDDDEAMCDFCTAFADAVESASE